jgi:hypothetical protein
MPITNADRKFTYDWSKHTAPEGAVSYDQFDFEKYLAANPDVANNPGFTGQGTYRQDSANPNPTAYDSVYSQYIGGFPDNPTTQRPDYTGPMQGDWTLPENQYYGVLQARQNAVAPYVDEATGTIRTDLLGGQFTDPNSIPPEVLAERQRMRDAGYEGVFGAGGASAFDNAAGTGFVDSRGRQTIKGYQADQMTNPSLPPGTMFTPEMQQVQQNELLDPNGYLLDPNAIKAQQTLAQASQATAAAKTGPGSYDATQVNITPEATVQGQLADLMQQFEGGKVPAWAAGAMRSAQQMLAGRGMGASSIAGEAVVQAAMEAATPIAVADAQTRAQALFTNAAATNASKQFNATSKQQNDQFFADLQTTVSRFNAEQQTAISKFNAGEANAISQFNATVRDSREKFNTQNRLVIDQSNVTWRRTINTQNTAAKNAANQFNAANLLNISNTAMNNLWQDWRDAADFAFTSSENQKTRAHNIALATLQQQQWLDRMDEQQKSDFADSLGNFGMNVFGDIIKDFF